MIANAPGPPPPQPVVFRADRLFLFLIRDSRHDPILFPRALHRAVKRGPNKTLRKNKT